VPGPGMEVIGEEEKKEVLEVLEAGYLFRYGTTDDPFFKAKVYKLEQKVAEMAGVGSAFGVTMRDGFDEVDARAAEFRRVAEKYLHS
jgi:hypothetical protein